MTYPLSSEVVAGQATEAAQYNNLRTDALYLGADPASSGTVRDLLYSSFGSLALSALGSNTIQLVASETSPAAVMISGAVYSVSSTLTLPLSAIDVPDAGRYTIYAVAGSGGAFSLALTASGSAREIGTFLWDGSGIIPGTVHNLAEMAVLHAVCSPASAHGRLTLVAGDPVPDADIDQSAILYFVPYRGNLIGLYLFGGWEYFQFSALSIGKNQIAAGVPVDIFLSADSSGLHLSAVAWGSNGARASGTLQWVDGVRVSGSDASMRYLGTVALNAAGNFEDSRTGRLVWNENNRLARPILAKLSTAKVQGTNHINSWAPYFDEDAPVVKLLVPGNDCDFDLEGVGINSPISESDRGYLRAAALGILQDPEWSSPYTENVNRVPCFTHTCGNTPISCRIDNYDSSFQGVHEYVLGFWSNYSFYPIGTSLSVSMGEKPGLCGQVMA